MTEVEWFACTKPQSMLEFLRGKGSDRKLRLFACACCRQNWARFTDDDTRSALEVAERFADGQATLSELVTAGDRAYRATGLTGWEGSLPWGAIPRKEVWAVSAACARSPFDAASSAELAAREALVPFDDLDDDAEWEDPDLAKEKLHAAVCRDIFGPLPLRSLTFSSAWRSSNVIALAEAIYEEQAFDRLPILADALEDAGCASAELLNHCRSSGLHVRGCWVVDLLLAKE